MTERTAEEIEAFNRGYIFARAERETTKGAEPEPHTRILDKVRGMSDEDAARWLHREYRERVQFTEGYVWIIALLLGRESGRRERDNKALEKRIDELETLLLLERKP